MLSDGYEVPNLALGVWQIPDGQVCFDAVTWALEIGYRHVDTAQGYGNEASVGRALAASGIARGDVFVTTKFYPGRRDPAAELEASLARLQLDYVDLYLVHWPEGGPTWAWPRMERAKSLGFARSIGVSNFSSAELEEVMRVATSVPVVNQIQLSPFNFRRALLEKGRSYGLVHEAYSPLGTGRLLSNPVVQTIAARVGRPPAQVLIRWGLQHQFVVLAKSTRREHLAENARALEFTLSNAEMIDLDSLDRDSPPGLALESKWW
jgi:diketogulonate reductase-like aldo/keto reductase